jgi:hypothetical protein
MGVVQYHLSVTLGIFARLQRGGLGGERGQMLLSSLAATSLLEALVKTHTKTSADVVSFLH